MTSERRLAKVEASLSPTQLVLRWLAEAHAHGDLESYIDTLVATEPPRFPLDRLAKEAAEAARIKTRGHPRSDADAASDKAVRGAVFRVLLVLRINVVTHELLEREVLVHGLLAANLGLALDPCAEPAGSRDKRSRIVECRDLLLRRVDELMAAEAARTSVELEYLDGQPAGFPVLLQAWAAQLHEGQKLAAIAMGLAEHDGAPDPPPPDPAAFDARVKGLRGNLVEWARLQTYDQLGDGRRALAVAVRWLRPKVLGDDLPLPE